MLLYTDPRFLEHDTGRHPENPNRLRSILARLEKAALIQECTRRPFDPLPPEKIAEIHDPQLVAQAKQVADSGGGYLDADTVVCPRSYDVALLAAGACVTAVDDVLRGVASRAL